MIDITKQQEKKPFDRKGYAFDALVAGLPASIGIVLLKEVGVTGALPPMILLFGGAALVGVIRRRAGWVISRKKIWCALSVYPVAFIILPVVLYFVATGFRYTASFFSFGSSTQERRCLERINYSASNEYYYLTPSSNKKFKTHSEAMNYCIKLEIY